MKKHELEKLLVVGARIKIGKKYSKNKNFTDGEIITLIEGYFSHDNGLYEETSTCPAIFDKRSGDFDSIYHLFGNDLEDFQDCEVMTPNETN